MQLLRIVICEDNEIYLETLRRYVGESIRNLEINADLVLAARTVEQVRNLLMKSRADVFLLDIDLNAAETGYDLARSIRDTKDNPYIIFISEHLEYLMQAFKVHAFDFLPKPVTQAVLQKCLKDVHDHHRRHRRRKDDPYQLEVKIGSALHYLEPNEIICIERVGAKTHITTPNRQLSCYETLENLQQRLSPCSDFIRCHRGYIVNRRHIREIHPKTGEIIMSNEAVCLIGRKYRKEVCHD